MNELSKSITELIRAEVEGKVKGCEDCGGSGEIEVSHDKGWPPNYKPCPSCAPLRELLGELCWHEWEVPSDIDKQYSETVKAYYKNEPEPMPIFCKHCDAVRLFRDNPDLTTHQTGHELTVVNWMRRAGMWDGFVEWHIDKCVVRLNFHKGFKSYLQDCLFSEDARRYFHIAHAEILTNGLYLCQAIESWLKESTNG